MIDGAAPNDERDATGDGGSRRVTERDGERDDDTDGKRGRDEADGDAGHLDGIADGAGCTEIWERLSERREE